MHYEMTEFIGLRSKMYSIRGNGQDPMKKAKSMKTGVVSKTINFDHYLDCLLNSATQYSHQCIIQSRAHVVRTVTKKKST